MTVTADREDHSEGTLRRSTRLQHKAEATPNLELLATSQVMPSNAHVQSNNNSTLVGANDSDGISGDYPLEDARSLSADPDMAVTTLLNKPDIDAFSEYDETDRQSADDSEVEHSNKKNNGRSRKTLPSKRDQHASASTQPRKRKAGNSGEKKTSERGPRPSARKKQKVDKPTEIGTTQPVEKKQKANKPAAKRQRKVGSSKPKTAKARFLAASAEDKRPLPWGEPEVWAEVWPSL